MGVDTKAIIRKNTTLRELKDHLELKYQNVENPVPTSTNGYFTMNFKDGSDRRALHIFLNQYAFQDYGIEGILLDLKYWGNSVKIMQYILDKFGGYIDENDSDDIGFIPYNLKSYLEEDGTQLNEFKNEIIKELGYEKLEVALKLFDKYLALNK